MEEQLQSLTTNANILWVLLAGFLVFFMQAGFALVETGFTRAKNVAHTMLMNMMVFCIGALGFWVCGFAFAFGGLGQTFPATATAAEWSFSPTTLGTWSAGLSSSLHFGDQWSIIGTSGFFLSGIGLGAAGMFAFFLFQMVFMDTAATIPTGSGAERIKFGGFVVMGFWVSMFIYPLLAHWVWGGGWLANLGRSLGLGNGAADFAGSGVVHTTGGAIGLALAMVIGPRIGKFNQDGSANTIAGHNLPMGVLGTIILFFGWFGFNPGSALGIQGGLMNLVALAAINTLLAGAAGGMSAMVLTWLTGARKPDPAMSVNGILAGLVAVTAPCAFISPWAAVVIGLVAGVLVRYATTWLEKAHIDDPVGAVPVHMVNGIWGVIAVGLFANGNPDSAAWNGVDSAVTGLFYGGGAGQLLAQVLEAVAIAGVAFASSYAVFTVLKRINLLRSDAEHEVAGLDLPEMGMPGYISDGTPLPELGETNPGTSGIATPAPVGA